MKVDGSGIRRSVVTDLDTIVEGTGTRIGWSFRPMSPRAMADYRLSSFLISC
jgi:hypothetical protein